jgi:hypothetical protein
MLEVRTWNCIFQLKYTILYCIILAALIIIESKNSVKRKENNKWNVQLKKIKIIIPEVFFYENHTKKLLLFFA